jgi:hypothetical protein
LVRLGVLLHVPAFAAARHGRLSGAVRVPVGDTAHDHAHTPGPGPARGPASVAGETGDKPWRQDADFQRAVTPMRSNPDVFIRGVEGARPRAGGAGLVREGGLGRGVCVCVCSACVRACCLCECECVLFV